MRFFAKIFDELTVHELYQIMRARAAVFVGEQKIVYPDADGLDYQCMHVFATDENGRTEAYLGMFRADGLPDAAQFGRVLTVHHGRGTGAQLMRFAERTAAERLGTKEIRLDVQQTAEGFYRKLGYDAVSGYFIEAGIPNVKMRKALRSE